MEDNTQKHRFIVASAAPLLILGLILIIGLVFVFKIFISDKTPNETAQSAPQVSDVLKGKMRLSLVPAGGAGNTVRLSINADSAGATITGFDVVLRYNHNNLKLQDVESRLPGYRVIETDKQIEADKSELIITGLQDIGNEKPEIFKDTEIFQIVFTQSNTAKLADSLELVFEKATITDSNLINGNTQDILGSVEITL